jgi:hypothetical protein
MHFLNLFKKEHNTKKRKRTTATTTSTLHTNGNKVCKERLRGGESDTRSMEIESKSLSKKTTERLGEGE